MTEVDSLHRHTRKRLIVLSLVAALFLDLIPIPQPLAGWLPACTAMMTLYWSLHRPQNVGIGMAFILGLIVDVGQGTPFGQHALALIAAVYVIEQNRHQMLGYSYGFQALTIFGSLMLMTLILVIVHFFSTHQFTGWNLFVSPFISALLWPLLSKFMLYLAYSRRL
ncbi:MULTISPECIES: rod shape-determining protein MreD [Snodgrassella]|uniref:Rod shape-determining protein MreD n=1 Tax=Snodgrassella alvi TaxID=1196083 RepID=A0A2N9X6D8_9NEIS|nr:MULTISPECIES: rod shape-determining protein MreD [Snodgrassella]MCX8745977.1 rod shape-determining protein MreD [Snodgrassella sp. B3800]MCX8748269.1 rod shape-determining protein MreD [Snodgrassella sp. B3088]MCX8752745.1 rod shape-determining protein MreD [Snodgrassella sp. B3837]PIT37729.1 rod shape-determining protein MreD [Snodgrassella alvi]PIT38741.1 rod shape-determining protein MreD [Snodgrassella alvi]